MSAVERAPVDDARLRDALTVRARRRVRRDNTVSVDGLVWQTDLGFLATRLVTVARTLAEPNLPPWIEHEGRPYPLQPVDPVANARRTRPPLATTARQPAEFDPAGVLLDHAVGRRQRRAP